MWITFMCPVVPTHNILAVAAGAGKKNKTCGLCLAPWISLKESHPGLPQLPCGTVAHYRDRGCAPFITARVYLQPGGCAPCPPNSADLGLGLLDYRT